MNRPVKPTPFGRRTSIDWTKNRQSVTEANVKFEATPKTPSAFWKKDLFRKNGVTILAAAMIFSAFGVFVVKAGDDTGVYDFIKTQARPGATLKRTTTLPPIFIPQTQRSSQRLGYAPSYDYGYTIPRYTPRAIDVRAQRTVRKVKRSDKVIARKRAIIRDEDTNERKIVQNEPVAYCVRLCDGFFFPIGTGSDDFNKQESACNSVCPSAQTRVYVSANGSDGIEKSTHRGQKYAGLATAFSYRKQVDKSCSCAPSGVGMFSPSPQNDVTFKRGDVVMTQSGFKAYSGGYNYPHRKNDFIAASWSKSLSNKERSYLSILSTGGRNRVKSTSSDYSKKTKTAAFKTASSEIRTPNSTNLAASYESAIEASFPKMVRNVAPYLTNSVVR